MVQLLCKMANIIINAFLFVMNKSGRKWGSTGQHAWLASTIRFPDTPPPDSFSRPWSEISLNSVTDLLVSEGNTTMLVDCFSKIVHFQNWTMVPLPDNGVGIVLSQWNPHNKNLHSAISSPANSLPPPDVLGNFAFIFSLNNTLAHLFKCTFK